MQAGIYHVTFASANGNGEGLVVVKDTAVNGGDPSYTYAGQITANGSNLTVQLHVRRWRAGQSVFGNVQAFDLTVSGPDSNNGQFSVSGSITGMPQQQIRITGRRVADAA